MSNSTDTQNAAAQDAGGGGKPDAELYVAVVSLAVALVALLGTVMQVLQQYYASATGFANCDERVIGRWHAHKERIFKWGELRFEVRFKAPVIFVCPATNEKGPVKNHAVWIVDGTPKSQESTMTDDLDDKAAPAPVTVYDRRSTLPTFGLRARRTNSSLKGRMGRNTGLAGDPGLEKRIHTADNERATWLTLLTEFQRMELESERWQQREYRWHAERRPNEPAVAQPPFRDRQLTIAVQAKPRSWDTMPPNIKKPYATTTWCHIVEMAAMMGLHWKEFDRSRDKYRAEGNGYVLTGAHAADLGTVFNFQISGKCKFQDNRLVPSQHVKEFAFGLVPTLFRTHEDHRRLNSTAEDPRDQGLLLLGSTNEVAETVAWFGCNTRTADILRDGTKKHGHLFPLAFEILGMLSKPLYLPNLSFRMVPNPTVYTWDTKFFNLRKLLGEFRQQLESSEMVAQIFHAPQVPLSEVVAHLNPLQTRADSVCDALRQQAGARGEHEFTLGLCKTLYDAIAACDKYLGDLPEKKLVQVVLREHIQRVLHIVNEDEGDTAGVTSPGGTPSGPRISQLMDAAPERRHTVFMQLYFEDVMPHVVDTCIRGIARRDTPLVHEKQPSLSPSTSLLPVTLTPAPAGPPRSPGSPESPSPSQAKANPLVSERPLSPESLNRNSQLVGTYVTGIWCTLVFRMFCWLLLHEFHKNDRQIPGKSEVWGSRLPVYIC